MPRPIEAGVRVPLALVTLALVALALVTVASRADESRADESPRARHIRLTPAPEPKPVEAPSREEIEASISRGLRYLLDKQNRDGSFGTARRTKALNIYAPVPGAHLAFRSAVTGLCMAALCEIEAESIGAGRNGDDEGAGDGVPSTREALRRALDWMFRELPSLRRATADAIYNVWGHAYAIQGLAHVFGTEIPSDAERARIRELIASQIELLARYESVDGGWGYYDFRVGTKRPSSSSISFTTATALVAFREAVAIGIEVPERLVRRGLASIVRQQKPDLCYAYGEYLKMQPMRGINRPGGSLGRSQACNIALRLWGDKTITDAALENWLKRLYARNLWLDIGRKRPIPHEAWFQVAGYFYYYGHYYGARCIEALPEETRPFYREQMARLMVDHQERDGSWWDYPLYDYHQPYGTAFALMTLVRCLP